MQSRRLNVKHAKTGKVLSAAMSRCEEHGIRLTERRQQLLETILRQTRPVSAYELVEAVREDHAVRVPVMTVYRVLDLFAGAGIVHKLRSSNSYTACAHLACSHAHDAPQFLICEECAAVEELDTGKRDIDRMTREARESGFHVRDRQLEIYGVCKRCAAH